MLDSAYVEFAERKKGSVEPGKFADFAILDRDPTTIDPNALLGLEILGTVVDGRSVYASDERFSTL